MKKICYLFLCLGLLLTQSCSSQQEPLTAEALPTATANYLDSSGRDDEFTGGVKMITINTPKGDFKVWTKRTGNNPRMKLLLLHGGPGGTHEAFECFDSYLPEEGIEYYYYDQLGSHYSDQPNDTSLWNTQRFVEEVEQVRQALNLDESNLYLLGHSWGGILAMEYALQHQDKMKGLIISNMMSSVPAYNKYAEEVLGPQMPPAVLAELKRIEANNDFSNPRYMELLLPHFYTKHALRMPVEEWPDPVNRMFAHMNQTVYVQMQGHSEFGITGNASLKNWYRSGDLSKITVPTLTIGGQHDTMDPEHMKWMASQVQNGTYLHCPKGSHMAFYDDQKTYFSGLVKFIKAVDKAQAAAKN
ncbi:proline iminopeptidase-family hydrolase [Pontibacter akesuensis]|uniref:Proline iminopeptidase n=1 Tax=Pontibacter akesuensis TaxID=388950 RepID=A0A1I7KWJ7_9BACT|nr:proline iminopeptidase-family hydrolase [Pontibacter akesuensis]GHA80567.1 proline iminopeptidase [Pontibacter akesuensis]SFV01797.1 proline iminopeptidase [Pontibacter akesuensis]